MTLVLSAVFPFAVVVVKSVRQRMVSPVQVSTTYTGYVVSPDTGVISVVSTGSDGTIISSNGTSSALVYMDDAYDRAKDQAVLELLIMELRTSLATCEANLAMKGQ